MGSALTFAAFWSHSAAGFLYAALAIWVFHQYGGRSRQRLAMIAALALTAFWGIARIIGGPSSTIASTGETLRNLGWLGFLFALLQNGEGSEHPRTIRMLYGALLLALLMQPFIDFVLLSLVPDSALASAAAAKTVQMLRMIFAIGAIVLVHNLYTVSARKLVGESAFLWPHLPRLGCMISISTRSAICRGAGRANSSQCVASS